MRKKTIIIVTAIILSAVAGADKARAQRYIPKMNWVEVGAGSTDRLGFYVQAKYGFYTRRKHHWRIGVNYRQDTYRYNSFKIPSTALTADFGFFLKLFSDRKKTLFVSAGIQAIGGYEWVNWGRKRLSDGSLLTDRDRFLYGGAAGIEVEYFLNDRYVVLLHVREKCLGGSDLGLWHTEFGLGLKMMLK